LDILKRGFNSLFFPNSCAGCGQTLLNKENLICLPCIGKLPLTNSHLERDNLIERIFWGRIEIERATSYVYFKQEGLVQQIMHHFKYKGKKKIGNVLGTLFANELINSDFVSEINLIIPVPIHPKKKEIRGYNQSDNIAEGMSATLNIPWSRTSVKKIANTESQTKKKRYDRWKNVETVFKVVEPDSLKNKHILLIDDVLTTGSTLEACATELLKVPGTKVSIATIAVGL
tara:strand:- start:536 stop:1225 length:690 start_codon:yes stop_codon:yes gene_type:complete